MRKFGLLIPFKQEVKGDLDFTKNLYFTNNMAAQSRTVKLDIETSES